MTILGATDDRPRIEAMLADAADLAQRLKVWPVFLRFFMVRAQFLRACGDEAGWARELREAQRISTEIGATGWMARIARLLPSGLEA